MTEFGLWWIGVGVLAVGWLVNMAICGNIFEKNKHRALFYSFFWESVMCVLVGGVDICCALWAQKLCGVIGWYIASAVICMLAGIFCLCCAIDEHKKEKSSDLNNLSDDTSDSYAKEVKNIVEQLKSTANRLDTSTDTCRYESQSFERLQKERLQLRNGVKKVVYAKKGYAVRTTRSWIVMLITLAAVVGSCFLVNELVPTTNATYTLNEDGNYVVSGIKNNEKTVVILPWHYGKPVVEIGNYAFKDCAELESIVLPDSITIIGKSAFQNCTGLKEIVFPDSTTTVESYAFKGCSGLKNVEIPIGLKRLGGDVFSGCDGLESVVWNAEDCDVSLDSNFVNCPSLTTLTIGKNVKKIPSRAFYNCQSLTEVIFNAESCMTAGSYSFQVFEDCENFKNVTIGDSVKVIPDYLFCKTLLTSVVIPGSVTTIGIGAFEDCKNLTSVKISEGVVTIGENAFWGCEMLENIAIPDSVTSISESAFSECSKLTTVKIGKGVSTIKGYAFSYCGNLQNVEIDNSITVIGDCAFRSNGNLTKIVFHGTKEQWMAVEKGDEWYSNSGLTIVCSDGNLDVFGSEK